ncbi:phospholipid scramblase 2 isoform X2 [Betta splendens]|uniref:Phospholipid scramblase n=1 Tax=Betta splendens TaxID=158456 RepID=A0A9W2XCM6_BETSP|nr:phospholipid scramblase 2 isoform X2 [Betta splendens]
MSVVTNQPLPFGRLEREKHIQMIFRAFQNRCRPSESHSLSPKHSPQQAPAEWTEQLPDASPERKLKSVYIRPPGKLNRPVVDEQKPGGAAGSDFTSMLETVSQIHITARPELQETSCMCLQCCGPARACTLLGFDCQGRQVFYFERPFRVDACCLGCCLMEMRAFTPDKRLIGTICQRWSMFTPLLEVCDADGASALRIQGSCCPCRCVSNQQFQIVSNIGEKMGTIWKKWPGFNDEHNMDHEYFGLEVPLNMEPNTKVLLLAATFLLYHMFFEMS